ncbi:hypothetical protein GT348_08365 [Aristophania vespae]|uniref:Uncharacterized protein n=1 Tax=Aristophania vespae TaxID=2697033 RepID=A0A6P1NI80_9PROT|nr:hypothetical protein [Aristophania vespae]QHI96234.1 hypothetical protein GT348_08365 [Aristophania vespae]
MNDQNFYDWYQTPIRRMYNCDCSLPFVSRNFISFENVTKDWAQNSLDYLYRTFVCSLCENEIDDPGENIFILNRLANSDPSNLDGYGYWEAYQFHLTEKGMALVKECNLDLNSQEICPLFKAKLTAMFEEHDVGFDKKAFVPIQF